MALLRVGAALFIALTVLSGVAALATYRSMSRHRSQIARMHDMALRGRSYEPSQQWKHDENLQVIAANGDGKVIGLEVTAVVLSAIAALMLLLRVRHVEVIHKIQYVDRIVHVSAPAISLAPAIEVSLPVATLAPFPAEGLSRAEREALGEKGQAIVRNELLALEFEGWTKLGEKVPFTFSTGEAVDIDFVLKSPSGSCYCIDAKYVNAIVSYSWGPKRLDHLIEYRYGRFAKPKHAHAIAQSLESMDWAVNNAAFGFSTTARRFAIMCFCERPRLELEERNAYGLHLIQRQNLLTLLRGLEASSHGATAGNSRPIS